MQSADIEMVLLDLIDRCRQHGIRQESVYDFLEISQPGFSYWRRGERTPRRGDLLLARWMIDAIKNLENSAQFTPLESLGNKHEWYRINTKRFQMELGHFDEYVTGLSLGQ